MVGRAGRAAPATVVQMRPRGGDAWPETGQWVLSGWAAEESLTNGWFGADDRGEQLRDALLRAEPGQDSDWTMLTQPSAAHDDGLLRYLTSAPFCGMTDQRL
jgi:hypothetical protein